MLTKIQDTPLSSYALTDYLLPESILRSKYQQLNGYSFFDDQVFDKTLKLSEKKVADGVWDAQNVVFQSTKATKQKGGIILSMIPTIRERNLTTQQYCSLFKQHVTSELKAPLGMVISCVDYFELFNSDEIISPFDWEKQGIIHHHIRMTDFAATATPEEMIRAALMAKQMIEDGKYVLVHCKAGKARSLSEVITIIAAVEYAYGFRIQNEMDLAKLIMQLKQSRQQIKLNSSQEAMVLQTMKVMYKEAETDFASLMPIKRNFAQQFQAVRKKPAKQLILLGELLHSIEFKNALVQSSAYKKMGGYAARFDSNTKRSQHLQSFVSSVISAANDDWFAKILFDKLNPGLLNSALSEFVHSKPKKMENDKASRTKIHTRLLKSIHLILAELTGLDKQDQLPQLLESYEKALEQEKMCMSLLFKINRYSKELGIKEMNNKLIHQSIKNNGLFTFFGSDGKCIRNFIDDMKDNRYWVYDLYAGKDESIQPYMDKYKEDLKTVILKKFGFLDLDSNLFDKIIRQRFNPLYFDDPMVKLDDSEEKLEKKTIRRISSFV